MANIINYAKRTRHKLILYFTISAILSLAPIVYFWICVKYGPNWKWPSNTYLIINNMFYIITYIPYRIMEIIGLHPLVYSSHFNKKAGIIDSVNVFVVFALFWFSTILVLEFIYKNILKTIKYSINSAIYVFEINFHKDSIMGYNNVWPLQFPYVIKHNILFLCGVLIVFLFTTPLLLKYFIDIIIVNFASTHIGLISVTIPLVFQIIIALVLAIVMSFMILGKMISRHILRCIKWHISENKVEDAIRLARWFDKMIWYSDWKRNQWFREFIKMNNVASKLYAKYINVDKAISFKNLVPRI